MSEFIMTVIGVATVMGVCQMLTPDGDTKKYVRFAGALCLICAIVSPLIGAISRGETGLDGLFPSPDTDGGSYEEIYKNALAEGAKESAEASLTEDLLTRFELPSGSLEVRLSLCREGSSYGVESAQVVLNGSAVYADPREISEYINELLGCPCSVIYG